MPPAAIRTATADDNEALLELIFHSPQSGRLLLGSDRRPDFFARSVPYDESRVLVAEDGSGILGTVSCGLKSVLVGGESQRAAYIFDLAVAGRARGQGWAGRLLSQAEAWARERGAHLLYAYVLGGNRAGLRTFLAAGYREAARLVIRLFLIAAAPPAAGEGVRTVEEGDWPALARLVWWEFQGYDLLRAEIGHRLRELWAGLPGHRLDRVWAWGQPPTAVLGLWDYSAVSRAVPLRLPPELRLLAALSRPLRRLGLTLPPLPQVGQPLRYGLLLGAAGDDQGLRSLFLRVMAEARELGLDALLLFHDARTPPQWPPVRSFSGWYHLMAKPLRPDPAHSLGERPVWVDPVDL